MRLQWRAPAVARKHMVSYRFTTYQDARRVRIVDGLIFETNILQVSPVKWLGESIIVCAAQ